MVTFPVTANTHCGFSGFPYGSDISSRSGFASVTEDHVLLRSGEVWLHYSHLHLFFGLWVSSVTTVAVILLSFFNAKDTPCFIFALGYFLTRGTTLDAELGSVTVALALARHVPHIPTLVALERPINCLNETVH